MTLVVLPIFYLIFWGKKRRRLYFTRFVRLSWSLFRLIMEAPGLIRICISEEDRKTLLSASSTIIVATHRSLIDIIILVSLIKDSTCIFKGKLHSNFLMRFITANAFIANDGDPHELIARCTNALNIGYNLIIFPEGTRTLGGGQIHNGASHIALESLANILVVTIDIDTLFLRKGKGWNDSGDKTAVYDIKIKAILKPMDIIDPQKSHRKNVREITTRIRDAFQA